MEICVVASKKRQPLITKYLLPDSFKINYTPDYQLPKGFKPNPVNFRSQNELGAYRCFRGHQDAIKMVKQNHALIIEDDAVPNVDNWLDFVKKADNVLSNIEGRYSEDSIASKIVSLHGRRIEGIVGAADYEGVNFIGIDPVEKNHPIVSHPIKLKWCIGSLAYLINRPAMDIFLSTEYFGLGVDLFIANKLGGFVVIETSPFDHDRSKGSLVGNPR